MKSLFTNVLVASYALFANAQISDRRNCTVFEWDRQPGHLVRAAPIRVSAAQDYTSVRSEGNTTTLLPIRAQGDAILGLLYNVSSIIPDRGYVDANRVPTSYMRELIYPVIRAELNGQPWNWSVIGAVDTTQGMPAGSAAYLNFTQWRRCFSGTLRNCTGGVPEGTGIEACAAAYHILRTGSGSRNVMDGYYTLVNISAADVGLYRDPYANQNSGVSWATVMVSVPSMGLLSCGVLAVAAALML